MIFPSSPVDEWILALALLIGAILVIGKFARSLYRGVQRIEATLGTDEKGRTIAQRLDDVEHQLFPNGGGSLADKVNKIDSRQVELETKVGLVENMLTGLVERRTIAGTTERM